MIWNASPLGDVRSVEIHQELRDLDFHTQPRKTLLKERLWKAEARNGDAGNPESDLERLAGE